MSLWLAALLLFLGASACVYGWMQLGADKSGWDYMEYIKLVIGWGGAVFLFASGVGTAYTAVRDAFWPQKSALARSIRSQLPYPDAAPNVRELFAMVDKDIAENGQWFDKVAVGRQCQMTTLRNPRELQPLLDCIALRAPDALRRPYSEYAGWCQKSDTEWEDMLRKYRVRQGEREMAAYQAGNTDAAIEQNMVLACQDGSVTSRVTPELIRQTLLTCLRQGEGSFTLTPGCPIEQRGCRYTEMECFAGLYEETEEPIVQEMEERGEAELCLKLTSTESGKAVQYSRSLQTDIRTAEQILREWLRGELPDLKEWEIVPLYGKQEAETKRETFPPYLGLKTTAGVMQRYNRFTLEDVEVAAEGV